MITYDDYLDHLDDLFICDEVGPRKSREPKISKKRFNNVKSKLESRLKEKEYKTKEEAEKDLENQAYGVMGPVTFFLFKAFLSWIIGRMLNSYFFPEERSS
jgi:hypothetical protein